MDFKDFVQKTMAENRDGDGPTAQECWDYMARELQAEVQEACLRSVRVLHARLPFSDVISKITAQYIDEILELGPPDALEQVRREAKIDEHKRMCRKSIVIAGDSEELQSQSDAEVTTRPNFFRCSDAHPCERLKELREEKTHGRYGVRDVS